MESVSCQTQQEQGALNASNPDATQPVPQSPAATPVAASPTLSAEVLNQIRDMLDQRSLSLRFQDDGVERRFVQHRAEQYRELVRLGWPLLLIIYIMLLGMGMQFYPQDLFYQGGVFIWTIWLPGLLALLAGSLLPTRKMFDQHFELVVGVSGVVLIVLLLAAVFTARTPDFADHATINFSIMVLILAFASRIRFMAFSLMLCAAISISVLICLATGYYPNWLKAGHFVVLYSLVTLFILALTEANDRLSFAQSLMLTEQAREFEQINQQLTRVAREDVLSGLPNRRAFDDLFQREWERTRRERQPLSLLYVDLDYFKLYNDNYGHIAGDAVLQSVAAILRRALLRPADQAVRFSGESFVVVLPNTTSAGAIEVAKRILDAIDRMAIEHRWSQIATHLTASIGVASCLSEDEDGLQLLRRADDALYQAKREGRHRYCVDTQSC
jgi:diguanylate cyclase (GGDEF)-like protein